MIFERKVCIKLKKEKDLWGEEGKGWFFILFYFTLFILFFNGYGKGNCNFTLFAHQYSTFKINIWPYILKIFFYLFFGPNRDFLLCFYPSISTYIVMDQLTKVLLVFFFFLLKKCFWSSYWYLKFETSKKKLIKKLIKAWMESYIYNTGMIKVKFIYKSVFSAILNPC